jgi:hypothetical protein
LSIFSGIPDSQWRHNRHRHIERSLKSLIYLSAMPLGHDIGPIYASTVKTGNTLVSQDSNGRRLSSFNELISLFAFRYPLSSQAILWGDDSHARTWQSRSRKEKTPRLASTLSFHEPLVQLWRYSAQLKTFDYREPGNNFALPWLTASPHSSSLEQ